MVRSNFDKGLSHLIILCSVFILVIFSTSSYQTYNFASSRVVFSPPSNTPIKHIVIIMQENHAFDNMFGTYPGLPAGYGLSLSTCMPNSLTQKKKTPCTKPWNADSKQLTIQGLDISHTRSSALKAYDDGKMNGFIANDPLDCKNCSMAYFTNATIPAYWDYAQYYTLNDLMMSSALSFSLPNHLYAVAAQAGFAGTCLNACTTEYNLTFPQIGESLTNAGVSWGYYQQNWNDLKDCTGPINASAISSYYNKGGYDGFWSGLTDFTQVQTTAVECSSLLNLKDLQHNISTDTLPAVLWVEPQPKNSDHPNQGTWDAGQNYVTSIINSIEESRPGIHGHLPDLG